MKKEKVAECKKKVNVLVAKYEKDLINYWKERGPIREDYELGDILSKIKVQRRK